MARDVTDIVSNISTEKLRTRPGLLKWQFVQSWADGPIHVYCVTWHVQNRAKCRKLTSPVLWGFIDWDQTVDRKTFAEFEEDTHRYKKFKVFDEASLSLKQTKLDRE